MEPLRVSEALVEVASSSADEEGLRAWEGVSEMG